MRLINSLIYFPICLSFSMYLSLYIPNSYDRALQWPSKSDTSDNPPDLWFSQSLFSRVPSLFCWSLHWFVILAFCRVFLFILLLPVILGTSLISLLYCILIPDPLYGICFFLPPSLSWGFIDSSLCPYCSQILQWHVLVWDFSLVQLSIRWPLIWLTIQMFC